MADSTSVGAGPSALSSPASSAEVAEGLGSSPVASAPTLDPVLIVDDEKDNLEALQRLLRNQFAITTTTSPFTALKLIQQTEFHVIISDQRMPEMTGVEFFEKAKKLCPTTTRVLLTGYTDIESVVGAINRGHVYRYVAKPWDPEELKITVRLANEAYCLKRELESKNEALSRSNAELQEALNALRLLDRAKARFLSLVSHELNTPLTILTAFSGLLEEKKSEVPAEIGRAVDGVAGATTRFSQIVSETLTYVRLETEGEFHRAAFDLGMETRVLPAFFADALKKKGITFTVSSEGAIPYPCDGEKMRLALRKLIEDTIIRAPAQSEILLAATVNTGEIEIDLWRSGEVLSDAALEPLEPAEAIQHHHRNLGLGLAICRLIVEGHGGAMTLQSNATDGTSIDIRLPTAAV